MKKKKISFHKIAHMLWKMPNKYIVYIRIQWYSNINITGTDAVEGDKFKTLKIYKQ